jgi:cell division protein FtsL
MQIQSIRSEYKIVSKRFRYYNILLLLLVITLATTFIYVYTLRQENSKAKKFQNSLSKEKKKFQSSFDSLIYKYRKDTALLRDSLRKVKLK